MSVKRVQQVNIWVRRYDDNAINIRDEKNKHFGNPGKNVSYIVQINI